MIKALMADFVSLDWHEKLVICINIAIIPINIKNSDLWMVPLSMMQIYIAIIILIMPYRYMNSASESIFMPLKTLSEYRKFKREQAVFIERLMSLAKTKDVRITANAIELNRMSKVSLVSLFMSVLNSKNNALN